MVAGLGESARMHTVRLIIILPPLARGFADFVTTACVSPGTLKSISCCSTNTGHTVLV